MVMHTKQANFTLPVDLLREFRARVPRGQQSRVVAEALRRELSRQKFDQALEVCYGAWKARPHPELSGGTQRYLRRSRRSSRGRK
jgi:hypothetical protein